MSDIHELIRSNRQTIYWLTCRGPATWVCWRHHLSAGSQGSLRCGLLPHDRAGHGGVRCSSTLAACSRPQHPGIPEDCVQLLMQFLKIPFQGMWLCGTRYHNVRDQARVPSRSLPLHGAHDTDHESLSRKAGSSGASGSPSWTSRTINSPTKSTSSRTLVGSTTTAPA